QPVSANAMACVKGASTTISFNASSSTDQDVSCNRGYAWSLIRPSGRDTAFESPSPVFTSTGVAATIYPTYIYTFVINLIKTAGVYTLNLMVKDVNSCVDTANVRFRVSGATPIFTFNANPH